MRIKLVCRRYDVRDTIPIQFHFSFALFKCDFENDITMRAAKKKIFQSRREIDEKQNRRNRHFRMQCAVHLVTKYRYVIVVIKNEKPKIAKRDLQCKKKTEKSKCVIK